MNPLDLVTGIRKLETGDQQGGVVCPLSNTVSQTMIVVLFISYLTHTPHTPYPTPNTPITAIIAGIFPLSIFFSMALPFWSSGDVRLAICRGIQTNQHRDTVFQIRPRYLISEQAISSIHQFLRILATLFQWHDIRISLRVSHKQIIGFATLGVVVVGAISSSIILGERGNICRFSPTFIMSRVESGIFSEYIPMTGTVETSEADTTQVKVIAEVDELYWALVDKGLKATTFAVGQEYELVVTAKDTLTSGRFKIHLAFVGEKPKSFSTTHSLRMSLTLSTPRVALLLPVGGWYRDTGGKWIYLVLNKDSVVRQAIVLGCKNTEHFEVLSGLKPGDVVVTSTYDGLPLTETLTMAKMVEALED